MHDCFKVERNCQRCTHSQWRILFDWIPLNSVYSCFVGRIWTLYPISQSGDGSWSQSQIWICSHQLYQGWNQCLYQSVCMCSWICSNSMYIKKMIGHSLLVVYIHLYCRMPGKWGIQQKPPPLDHRRTPVPKPLAHRWTGLPNDLGMVNPSN